MVQSAPPPPIEIKLKFLKICVDNCLACRTIDYAPAVVVYVSGTLLRQSSGGLQCSSAGLSHWPSFHSVSAHWAVLVAGSLQRQQKVLICS